MEYREYNYKIKKTTKLIQRVNGKHKYRHKAVYQGRTQRGVGGGGGGGGGGGQGGSLATPPPPRNFQSKIKNYTHILDFQIALSVNQKIMQPMYRPWP